MTKTIDGTGTGREMFATDFDRLELGDSYESPPHPIATTDVAVFAALTGDHHPIHVDADWAAQGPFGRPIAHGMLVLSCAVGSLPLDPDRVLALRRVRDVVFKRPLDVGDSMTVTSTVRGLRPLDASSGLVCCEWRIAGSDGRLRARAIVDVLWRRATPENGEIAAPDAAERHAEDPAIAEAIIGGPLPRRSVLTAEPDPVETTADGLRVLI